MAGAPGGDGADTAALRSPQERRSHPRGRFIFGLRSARKRLDRDPRRQQQNAYRSRGSRRSKSPCKSSAQSLDELEVTLTPVLMRHRKSTGRGLDIHPVTRSDAFDVTLVWSEHRPFAPAGGTPVGERRRARCSRCSSLSTDRVSHNHWAHSPTPALKPGWRSKASSSAPAFFHGFARRQTCTSEFCYWCAHDGREEAVALRRCVRAQFADRMGFGHWQAQLRPQRPRKGRGR